MSKYQEINLRSSATDVNFKIEKRLEWWRWCYPTLPRGVEELYEDPTVGPRPKIWTIGQMHPLELLLSSVERS